MHRPLRAVPDLVSAGQVFATIILPAYKIFAKLLFRTLYFPICNAVVMKPALLRCGGYMYVLDLVS